MSGDTQLEVEVKFLVADLKAFRERLLAAGGTLAKARIFERNVRFDTPDNDLLKKGQLLRLRQMCCDPRLVDDGSAPPASAADSAKLSAFLELATCIHQKEPTI